MTDHIISLCNTMIQQVESPEQSGRPNALMTFGALEEYLKSAPKLQEYLEPARNAIRWAYVEHPYSDDLTKYMTLMIIKSIILDINLWTKYGRTFV